MGWFCRELSCWLEASPFVEGPPLAADCQQSCEFSSLHTREIEAPFRLHWPIDSLLLREFRCQSSISQDHHHILISVLFATPTTWFIPPYWLRGFLASHAHTAHRCGLGVGRLCSLYTILFAYQTISIVFRTSERIERSVVGHARSSNVLTCVRVLLEEHKKRGHSHICHRGFLEMPCNTIHTTYILCEWVLH